MPSFAAEMRKLAADDMPILDPNSNRKNNVLRSSTRMYGMDVIPNTLGAIGGGVAADALVRHITHGSAIKSKADGVARIVAALSGGLLGSTLGGTLGTAYNYNLEDKAEERRIINAVRRQERAKMAANEGTLNSIIDSVASRAPYYAGLIGATNAYGADKHMSPQKKLVTADLTAQLASLGVAGLGTGGALLALRMMHKKAGLASNLIEGAANLGRKAAVTVGEHGTMLANLAHTAAAPGTPASLLVGGLNDTASVVAPFVEKTWRGLGPSLTKPLQTDWQRFLKPAAIGTGLAGVGIGGVALAAQ